MFHIHSENDLEGQPKQERYLLINITANWQKRTVTFRGLDAVT